MSSTATFHDYYEILGVHQLADTATITSSYRRLALATHPDRSKAPNATAEFQLLGEAYEHLSDANKRRRYDAIYEAVILPTKSPGSEPKPRIAELKARLLQLKNQRKETETRLRNAKNDLERLFAEMEDLNREISRVTRDAMIEEFQFLLNQSERRPGLQTSRRNRGLMIQQYTKLRDISLAMSRVRSLRSRILDLSAAADRIRAEIRMLGRRQREWGNTTFGAQTNDNRSEDQENN